MTHHQFIGNRTAATHAAWRVRGAAGIARAAAVALGGVLAAAGLAGSAYAQDAATSPPSTVPAQNSGTGEVLVAKITAVKGVVQVRTAEDQPWKPATVGMEVDEGAEFRTGPRSAVQFVIPPDQTITLDRLGTIKVLQAVKDSGKVTTALGMKYGRTRLDVQAADLEHDSTIRSPGSTLAIRGTDVTFEDMAPFPPNAVSREGRAVFRTNKRQLVAFGGKQRANVSAERSSPAETALVRTRSDPQSNFSGRSEAEKGLVLNLPSLGGGDLRQAGVPGFREQARIDVIQDVLPPPPPPPGPGPTPPPPSTSAGELLFELMWTGEPFADLDLEIARGGGEIVSGGPLNGGPGSPVPSGGRHLGNLEATSAGAGAEAVRWSPTFPPDHYLVRVYSRNDALTQSQLKVTRDPGTTGANEVLFNLSTLGLSGTNPFFQTHVAAPSDLTTSPPPLPNPPPFMQLPRPVPGPNDSSPMGMAQPPTAAPQTAVGVRSRGRR